MQIHAHVVGWGGGGVVEGGGGWLGWGWGGCAVEQSGHVAPGRQAE